jgi:hypothetical protein
VHGDLTPLDAQMGGKYGGDAQASIYVPTDLGVGTLPFCGEYGCEAFWEDGGFLTKQAVYRTDKSCKVPTSLKASPKIFLFLFFSVCLQDFGRKSFAIRCGVRVGDSNAKNAIGNNDDD